MIPLSNRSLGDLRKCSKCHKSDKSEHFGHIGSFRANRTPSGATRIIPRTFLIPLVTTRSLAVRVTRRYRNDYETIARPQGYPQGRMHHSDRTVLTMFRFGRSAWLPLLCM